MEHPLAHLPHHDGSPLYVSDQTPELGETVRVRVRVPRAFGTMRIVPKARGTRCTATAS